VSALTHTLRLLQPRYWPTWVMLGVMRLLSLLPMAVLRAMARVVGALLVRLPLRFVHIARRNLELCLPELPARQRRHILHGHFRSLVMGVFETAISWWASDHRIFALTRLEGEEHLRAALERGHGVILLTAHFTTLEIGARSVSTRLPLNIMYRPTRNPVLDHFLNRMRARRTKRAIARDDIRTLIGALRDNEPVWYAPDQSYRKKGAQMVPFFGVPAATNTATSRLARMTDAAVLPFFQERLPGSQGYRAVIHPMLENFPSEDPSADAERFNKLIEQQIRRTPEQYLWIHRRFKGLTAEYPDFYRK
jgi:Kdo2-lipid IVA lauroyltransferase/acyltransferase